MIKSGSKKTQPVLSGSGKNRLLDNACQGDGVLFGGKQIPVIIHYFLTINWSDSSFIQNIELMLFDYINSNYMSIIILKKIKKEKNNYKYLKITYWE